MSHHQRRRSKRARTVCLACAERKARFRHGGRVRADRHHTLCFACHRAQVNRVRHTARWWPCTAAAAAYGGEGRVLSSR